MRKRTARLHGFVLATISYQKNPIIPMETFDEFVHLSSGGKRRLVEYIQALLSSIRLRPSCKVMLESRGLHAGLGELVRSARCRRKPLDLIPLRFCTFTDYSERGRFPCAGDTIESDNPLATQKDIIHRFALGPVQFRMAFLCPDSQLRRDQHRLLIAMLIAALHVTDDLSLHAHHFSGRVERSRSAICPRNSSELPSHHPLLKLLSNLDIGSLSHAAVYGRLQDRAFILNSRPLKDMIA